MSVLAIWTWSCKSEDAEDVLAALDRLIEHCEAEHPLIMRLGWYSAPDNDGATVAFRWLEEYDSRESMAGDEFTEVCEALWEPIKSFAIDDSFAGAAFDQGGLIQR